MLKFYWLLEAELTAVYEEIQERQAQPWATPTPYHLQKRWAELAEEMHEAEMLLRAICL